MIDIQLIRDNPDMVTEKARNKGYEIDAGKILELDSKRRELVGVVEGLRAERNQLSGSMKGGRPSDEQLATAKELKQKLGELESELTETETNFNGLLKSVPNIYFDNVPVGSTEEENVVTKTVGEQPNYDFEPRPHWELLEAKNMIDKERAVKISGSRFMYLKGDLVRLQFALIQFVMESLGDETLLQKLIDDNNLNISNKAFTPVLPPAMLRTEPYQASARLDAEEVTYRLTTDDLWLNASAEHTLCTMYWNEILPEAELPIRYIGYSPSFRREAGTYGKDTEGLIRLHQFDKLEMEVFSTGETGFEEHKLLIAVQEHLVQQLKIQYNFVQKCTADIGKPNASGIDIDCWFPGQGRYIETHTADYMTDYQARDLNTRYKKADGNIELVHTNDATAFAIGRILAAIVENYQDKDGSIRVPAVLQPYMGGKEKI